MLDYQRIVDDIRSSLVSHSAEGMDFLRAAAADYSVACDEMNERLRQCGTLLRQGLRSEAIQLGEIDPNVLDAVAILDFPERDQWIELAKRNNIAPPTPLMLDVAAELNEAYAIEQPLATLLQHHRLLALAHASLSTRIQVLRKLAEMDTNNPVWQEDLRTFEQERQKQLQAEVETAARTGNTAALVALDAELSSPEWKNPPLPDLAKAAADAKARVQYWVVQSQLDGLAGELESAMSHGQMDRGETLHGQWHELIARSGCQPYEPLLKRATPALNWVQKHLNHEAAVAALTEAVDNERSATRLQAAYRLAVDSGALPAGLEERYQSQLAAIRRAAQRRMWFKISGALGAGIAVVFAIAWLVSRERYEQEIASASKSLPFLIERGEYERAESLADNLSSTAKRDPRLQEPLGRLEERLKHEGGRQTEFSQRLGSVDHWLEQVRRSLAHDSGQAALARLREELTRIQTDLARAKEVARTEQERAKVVSIEDLVTQTKEQWQRQLDQAFLKQYEDYDKRLTEIERDKRSSLGESERQIGDYKSSLRHWETASTLVSRELVTRIITLSDRVASLEKDIQQRRQEERDEKQITSAIGDVEMYLKALKQYVQHHPSSDRTADLKRAAEESLCWQAVAEWNKLAMLWRQSGFAGFRPPKAEDRLALANTVSDNFAECSECEGLPRLLPYLNAIAQRDNGGERIEASLHKLFADPLVANAWMVEIKTDDADGSKGNQRYYFREQPQVTSDFQAGATFRFIASFDGKTKTRFLKKDDKIQYAGRAPQAAVAEQIQPILKAVDDDNWEKSFCQIIATIHSDHAMDPILKVNLLQQVLDTGTRGSHYLATAFGHHLEWIQEARINAFSNWLDPSDSTVANERKDAAKKLERFPDVDAAIKAVEQDMKTKYRLAEFRWIGWLHRDQDGRWECLMNASPNETGPLYVVCRQPPGEKPILATIGRYDRRAAAIDETAGRPLAEGRPVFLKVP